MFSFENIFLFIYLLPINHKCLNIVRYSFIIVLIVRAEKVPLNYDSIDYLILCMTKNIFYYNKNYRMNFTVTNFRFIPEKKLRTKPKNPSKKMLCGKKYHPQRRMN